VILLKIIECMRGNWAKSETACESNSSWKCQQFEHWWSRFT